MGEFKSGSGTTDEDRLEIAGTDGPPTSSSKRERGFESPLETRGLPENTAGARGLSWLRSVLVSRSRNALQSRMRQWAPCDGRRVEAVTPIMQRSRGALTGFVTVALEFGPSTERMIKRM